MIFPKKYNILKNNNYTKGKYSIVPIRYQDRYEIMNWRNKQIELLRQDEILTPEMQDKYFKEIVAKLYDNTHPKQLLFSFMYNDVLIGYGGLVHIDWKNKNAEISFLLNPTNTDIDHYIKSFEVFLDLINQIAIEIKLHKIYTYGYDLKAYRFKPLINKTYNLEAILKQHVLISNQLTDIKIYAKLL